MTAAQRRRALDMRASLVKLFPNCFMQRGRAKKPLKLDIASDIAWRCPQLLAGDVTLALNDYCRGQKYLEAMITGATRIDLDGAPFGHVTRREAAIARKRLFGMLAHNLQQKQKTRGDEAAEARP